MRRSTVAAVGLAMLAFFAAKPHAGDLLSPAHRPFTASAYCDRGTTKAGVRAQRGVAAADPAVLPVGSVIRVDAPSPEHAGIYTVLDTGGKVIGRRIDLFVPDCGQARRFGLQHVLVRVLRLGWDPRATPTAAVEHVSYREAPDDLSDGAITARVKSRLALDDTIRSRDIHVETKDAVVTLSGQVASNGERDRALKLTSDTDGVKSVVDHLQVKG
jgi:3D (Asp-Asp-Asp) domain-containing protein